ncbi:hypothetical protein B0A52_03423 [Exophiala mesophila]|uniref:Nitroreductase domain-containing protein n=1 Tax=Exophiala mesophila TaxID=212818 RepID=A0A438N5P0_EXOME|nr:hypothetical protein B0A52_03423 [Exophiala mesophila]
MSTTTIQTILDAILQRRSNYNLQNTSPIPDSEIQQIITHAILHVPSAFNAQTTRVILLLGQEHHHLWEGIVKEILSGIVPGEAFATTEKKLNAFRDAYATILFFEDQASVRSYQEKFSLYADRFPVWASESSGMHQYAIWTALAVQGLAANLQHYNPLIDQKVAARWNVAPKWKLVSQMVIGTPLSPPSTSKTFLPVNERFRTYGSVE